MKSFLRFIKKNKLYTLIEVVGMAVAIAFVLYIGTFLIGLFTSDSFIKKQGDIYVGQSERMYIISPTVKEQMEGKFPEIQDICRIIGTDMLEGMSFEKRGGTENRTERQNALIADANFFELFPFPLVEGEHSEVFAAENSVLLSESCAARMFPDKNPVGQNITISDSGKEAILMITGIFEDFHNSVFPTPDIIYRIEVLESLAPSLLRNGNGTCTLFYKLHNGVDVENLEARMETVMKENDFIYIHGLFKEFHLTPFKDIATNNIEITIPFTGIIPSDFVSTFIGAGILLLLFAILNYISLTVAQTGFRAREMASRRLVGAQRSEIIIRYIAESFLLTLVSFGTGLLLASLLSPQFSELVRKEVDPLQQIGGTEIGFMLALVLVLSFLAGIIPAMMVSKYKPIDVVRGTFTKNSKMVLSKILIACQSTIAVVCIAVAIVMVLQLKHLTNRPMGYERDGRIMITGANKPSDYHVEELKSLAGVENAGWLQYAPMIPSTNAHTFDRNGSELNIDAMRMDKDAFDILGFEVVRQNAEPTEGAIWLTESLMISLGLDYDCTQIALDNGSLPVCGIIKDFHKGKAGENSSSGYAPVPWMTESSNSLVVEVSGDENEAAGRIRDFYSSLGFSDEIYVETYNQYNVDSYSHEGQNIILISIFTALVILLASLAMLAMSVYYGKQHAREAALHKVFGCSRSELFLKTAAGFLKTVAWAVVVALPVAYLIAGRWLEGYSWRIDNHIWIYLVAALVMAFTALLSVTWQTMLLINTNPVEALKKE